MSAADAVGGLVCERVCVVIPTYNRCKLLERALRSVAAQDHRPLEVVVIDDGSSDGTRQRLREYRQILSSTGVKLTYRRQPNTGPAAARNRALRLTTAPFVCFLDSDDTWRPRFVSTLLQLLQSHPTAALAFCAAEAVDMDGRVIDRGDAGLPESPAHGLLKRPGDRIIRQMPLATSAVVARRDAILAAGGFDESFRVGEDWDLWYRLGRQYDFAYTLNSHACAMRHPGNRVRTTVRALADRVRLALKHVEATHDPAARQALEDQAARYCVLLQERLLDEEATDPNVDDLLHHPAAQRRLRFKISAALRDRPRWLRQTYLTLVRAAGSGA